MSEEFYIKYRNGYPDRKTIGLMLKDCDVEITRLTFCADYSIKRAGILWKAHCIDDNLKEFLKLARQMGVEIARSKFHGQIHSIWFKQNNDYL